MRKLKTHIVFGRTVVIEISNLFIAVSLATSVLLSHGCSSDDPYNPLIGPRNPVPGALRYLNDRNDIDKESIQKVIIGQRCNIDVLERFVLAESMEVRFLVASNPGVTEDILSMLAKDADAGVRQAVAQNKKTPRNILLKLKNDPDVQFVLPSNQNWTENDLREFYENEPDSYQMLAKNVKTPKDIMYKLLYKDDYLIDLNLATNPAIDEKIALGLLRKNDNVLIELLIENPSISIKVRNAANHKLRKAVQ